MRLRIIETNFTKKFDWLYKLSDESGNEFFIMSESFYKTHGLRSPITKKELDYYDIGLWISVSIREIDGKGIVIGIQ